MGQKDTVRELSLIAFFSAITFAVTFFNIPLFPSTGGLIHFGNVFLFTAALLFGPKYGAWSGAIGMGLFDVLGGYAIWAPCTIIVRYLMGLVVGHLGYQKTSPSRQFLAMVMGGIICIVGYYVYEGIFISNFIVALSFALGDLISITAAIIITFLLLPLVKRLREFVKIRFKI
jgi:uncharacterized membrane protein